jgi:hypothetical protein
MEKGHIKIILFTERLVLLPSNLYPCNLQKTDNNKPSGLQKTLHFTRITIPEFSQ